MDLITKTKNINHPLEDIFDIQPNSTVMQVSEVVPSAPVDNPMYDERDVEIDVQLEQVYTTAMTAAVDVGDEMERVEGKFKARMGEVMATNLNVALSAIREKADIKKHKDKLKTVAPVGNVEGNYTVNNNVIVADRNEILRAFASKK